MKMFSVDYSYRRDGGMVSAVSTHEASLTVEADDADAARGAAIDEAYKIHPSPISHVKIRRVTPC